MGNTRDPRPIVVGVDQSRSARDAALWAADLAVVWGVPLHLCHVVKATATTSAPAPLDWLDALATTASNAGAPAVEAQVHQGSIADVLGAQAAGAQLLVLGSYGEHGWSGTLIGTIARRMIERCACPVVVARGLSPGLAPPRGGPVVVGVDGTPASTGALLFAAEVASRTQHRRLLAVHAWSEIGIDSTGHPYRLGEDPAQLAEHAEKLLESQLAPVRADHPDLIIDRDVHEDTPLRALLDHARHAWLVVVGQRAEPPQPGMRAGSTSRGMVEFAPCPVAVVAARPSNPPAD